MSTEENKAVVRRYWEGFNAHNLNVWDEVCTPNHRSHDMPGADLPAIKEIIGGVLTALPDVSSSEDDLLTDGDRVVVRRTFRGTHKGALMDVAPTGKAVTFSGIFIHRIAGGKIEEQWAVVDIMGLMQQLGAIPSPSQTG